MGNDNDNGCCGKGRDLVQLGPMFGDHFQHFIRHKPNCEIQTGFLRRVRDGEPILNGALQLGPLNEEGVHEVLGEIPSMMPSTERSGPPKVTTDAYRDGWDHLFGNKIVGQA
jgi:hypothetical protein